MSRIEISTRLHQDAKSAGLSPRRIAELAIASAIRQLGHTCPDPHWQIREDPRDDIEAADVIVL